MSKHDEIPAPPDLKYWPSTVPGEFVRGDWIQEPFEVYLNALRDYADFQEFDHPRYIANPEPFKQEDFETVTLTKREYRRLTRRAEATEALIEFAHRALAFANNRDMARMRVLDTIREVRKYKN